MRRILPALFALLTVGLVPFAEAQNPVSPKLTWIRYFQLPPASRASLTQTVRGPLDGLLSAKKIDAWGIVEPVSRVGEPWTHAIYVSVQDWAAIDAVTVALDATGLTGAEHVHDAVLRHVVQSETPPVPNPKYLVVNTHPVSRGRDSDAFALFNEWAKPIFVKIAANGKLGPWGLSVQSFVLDNKWTYMVWYFISDTSVLDDVHAALVDVGLPKLGTYERRLREMSEDDYIGQLLRVVHSAP